MQVLIPAAGFATRMRPLSLTKPKSLIPVAGKPIIGHILDQIGDLTERIVLVVGENGEGIVRYVRSRGYDVDFVIQRRDEMFGLAYAVGLAKEKVREDEPLLIILGDTPFRMDLREATDDGDFIAVKAVEDPRRFGVVKLKDGYVVDMVEKPEIPPSNLAIVGIYYFRNVPLLYEAIDYVIRNDIRTKGEYQLTDAMREMIRRGWKARAVEVDEWLDCGTLDQTIVSQRRLLEWNSHYREREGVVVIPPVYIDDSATVERSVIGPNVHIGEGAIVRNAIIRDSIVDAGTLLEDVILENSLVGERAKVRGKAKVLRISDYSHVSEI
ncbi:MAG: NTP transferase domain-containing protein [Thermotogae bacterium]|nr:NTP transferase domain-containing protein [Thermotogota bacterium]